MSYGLAYTPYNTNLFMRTKSIDPAAQDFIDAAGITGDVQQQAINNLVKGLKTDGLWSKMKAVYPFVTDNRNILSYSEDFTNAYWTRQNTTIIANQTTAPNGTTTADQTIISANNSFHDAAIGSYAIVAGQTYTLSFYAKKGVGIESVYHYNNDGNRVAKFNLNDGSYIGNASVNGFAAYTSYGSQSVGNGWYRFYATFTAINTTSTTMVIAISNNTTNTVAPVLGNGTDNAFVWGAQVELGNTLTTYQPQLASAQAAIASQFKYNLKDPRDLDAAFRLVFNGGWTHSSTGATPNGTNGYADTKLVPSSVLGQNSTHFSNYFPNFAAEAACQIGVLSVGNVGALYAFYRLSSTVGAYIRANQSTDTFANSSQIDNSGLRIVSRTASDLTKVYVNNTNNYSSTQVSTDLSVNAISISALNSANTRNNFSALQQSFCSIGDGLTDTEAANLYTRVQAFQTSLSRQV